MATYIILSHIAPDAIKDPKDLKDLAETVAKEIKEQCPGVKWKDSFATMGRFDVVDVVEALDPKDVE
ncbi:MAG: GYD domain-containing protein, partial [Verrucomicrobia bacterium]|nr:GYD domain-containing protein [Verrucomicrobiota bacterium]